MIVSKEGYFHIRTCTVKVKETFQSFMYETWQCKNFKRVWSIVKLAVDCSAWYMKIRFSDILHE